jgi:hypothetical protein
MGVVNELTAAVDNGNLFKVRVALGVNNQVAHGKRDPGTLMS